MRAIQYNQLGPPEVLQYVEVDQPTPKKNQILIKVAYAGINHTDIHFRRGLPGVTSPLPHIPGCDASGIVEEIGPQVQHLKKGDRVFINPTIYCQVCEFCQKQVFYLCKKQQLIGRETDGSYAQFLVAPSANVFKIPDGVSLKTAAAVPLVYQTAYAMVVSKAKLQEGETILVMGAGSGVGMAAIQMAKHIGATVLTTASTTDKCTKAKEILHADFAIQYTEENLKQRVKEITCGAGVDVVIDHVGGSQWCTLIQSLKNGGRLITCGATDGYQPKLDLRHVFFRQLHIMGSTMASPQDMHAVMQLIFEGIITPHIDNVFPLQQAASAHQYMQDRKVFGKLLLKIDQD